MTTASQATVHYSGAPEYGIGRLPLGVALIAVLVGIVGFIVLLDGLFVLLLDAAFLNVGSSGSAAPVYGQFYGGAILSILGAVLLGTAVGLWDQRLWALVLAITVSFLLLAFELPSGGTLGIVLAAVLFVYLVAVHRHFD